MVRLEQLVETELKVFRNSQGENGCHFGCNQDLQLGTNGIDGNGTYVTGATELCNWRPTRRLKVITWYRSFQVMNEQRKRTVLGLCYWLNRSSMVFRDETGRLQGPAPVRNGQMEMDGCARCDWRALVRQREPGYKVKWCRRVLPWNRRETIG